MRRAKALQGNNSLPNQTPMPAQSNGTKNCPDHTSAWGKDMLTERDGCTERPVNQITPPCQGKRRLLTGVQYTILLPNRSRPLFTLTLAHSSLGVHSSKTVPVLCYCVSAFQFLVSLGPRTEENKLNQ